MVPSRRYRLTGLPVDYQLKNISSSDVTNLLLEELIIWTNYEIEVAAYNGAGLGAFSHRVTEWTLQGGERAHLLVSGAAEILQMEPGTHSRLMKADLCC